MQYLHSPIVRVLYYYIHMYLYKMVILHHGMQSFHVIVYCMPVYCTLVYCMVVTSRIYPAYM